MRFLLTSLLALGPSAAMACVMYVPDEELAQAMAKIDEAAKPADPAQPAQQPAQPVDAVPAADNLIVIDPATVIPEMAPAVTPPPTSAIPEVPAS